MDRLTATAVKANLLKPGTYQDGDGLFLKVRADRTGGAGSAQWLVRIQRDGKRQDVGLVSAKLLTLAYVRAKADELCKAVKVEKRDVLAERKDEAAAKVIRAIAALLRRHPCMIRVEKA
ncbi:MAG: Arm DNA-binding domain-containing protein [Sphingomonadaceae bacterium]